MRPRLSSWGLGSGAFGVLLLRLPQKRFSATQYALLSSLFTLPRILAGPIAGVAADALGWRDFFVLSVFTGIPGMMMLARFVPWSVREPVFEAEAASWGAPLGRRGLAARAILGALLVLASGALALCVLGGLSGVRAGHGFDLLDPLRALFAPRTVGEWIASSGLVILAVSGGLATAATLVARRGLATRP